MKKLYELYELQLILLEEDVIRTSGVKVDVSGWGNEFDKPLD